MSTPCPTTARHSTTPSRERRSCVAFWTFRVSLHATKSRVSPRRFAPDRAGRETEPRRRDTRSSGRWRHHDFCSFSFRVAQIRRDGPSPVKSPWRGALERRCVVGSMGRVDASLRLRYQSTIRLGNRSSSTPRAPHGMSAHAGYGVCRLFSSIAARTNETSEKMPH